MLPSSRSDPDHSFSFDMPLNSKGNPYDANIKEAIQGQQFLSHINISDVQFFDDLSQNQQQITRRFGKATNANTNAANIFRVKFGNGVDRRDRLTYVRYQNYSSARNRKSTEQKIYQINNFVKKLTENTNKEEEIPQISQTKFRALKKIIEYYDIKNLDRSEYSSMIEIYTDVIKSFGLQIGSVRAEPKMPAFSEEKRNQLKKLKAVSILRQTEKKLKSKAGVDFTNDESQLSKGDLVLPRQIVSVDQSKVRPKNQGLQLFTSLQVRKQRLKGRSPKKFKFNGGENCILEKVNKFREFLFVLNYSNRLYRSLNLESYPRSLRYFIGRGNNGNLIRSLMKRRFWFEETTSEKQAHFIWTQIKIVNIFNRQCSVEGQTAENMNKSSRRSPPKIMIPKNDPLGRILVIQQLRDMMVLQQLVKTRNIQNFEDRLRLCAKRLKKQQIQQSDIVHNHLPGNGLLGNKKAMFLCMRQYCRLVNIQVFDIVPRTFIINHGPLDPQYSKVSALFSERKQNKQPNFWIMKPGEFSNRGNGIQCTNKLQQIKKRIVKTAKQRKKGSLIVQEYITRPLLYNGRKFDIRAYMIITWHNGKAKGYWYQDGYVRTSCAFFNLDQMSDPYIHLTNDAVQKNSDRYGHFQDGNKLSYPELQRYFDSLPALGRVLDLHNVLIPKMKEIAGMAVRAAWMGLNRQNRDKNFELFGLDFMVDQDFKPWLIQVNTNPCLELSSPVLERLIPHMVENVLRIAVDTLFPPPDNYGNNYKYNIPQNSLHYNKFELVFDSDRDGPSLFSLYDGHNFFKDLDGLQQDKNQYKQEGEIIDTGDF